MYEENHNVPLSQIQFSEIRKQLDEFGPYQIKQLFLHLLAWVLSGVHTMSWVFVFPNLEHRCFLGENLENVPVNETFLEKYIPRNEQGVLSSCQMFEKGIGVINNNTTISCTNGCVYTSNYFQSSRITEWDMVCEKEWMRAMLQSLFLFGAMVGALGCGHLSDLYGRKVVFCSCGVLQLLSGTLCASLDNYVGLSCSMFLYGIFGGAGPIVPAVALTSEIVKESKQSICGTLLMCAFSIGSIVVVAWAYFLPGNARLLQLIYALHSILLFGHWWWMDESVCWLWTNGKREEALEIARKAMQYNGKELIITPTTDHNPQVKLIPANEDSSHLKESCNKSHGFMDILKYPEIRKRTFLMSYCWLATNVVWFGLTFNSVNLLGNPYLMFLINVGMEVPGNLVSFVLAPKTGYKGMICGTLFCSGIAAILLPYLNIGVTSTVVSMLAKVVITITYNMISSYTSALFPTVFRNTAVGFCIMGARLGATLIPVINLMAHTAEEMPNIILGCTGVLASVLVLFLLPETINRKIPQTVEDVEVEATRS